MRVVTPAGDAEAETRVALAEDTQKENNMCEQVKKITGS